MRFSGKVVAINGGTWGIGAAAVKRFVEEGATVYFSGRNEEKAEQVASTNAHLEGIRVVSISPGPTETDLAVKAYGSQRAFDENSSHHPRGSYATPDEIAPAVLFLASAEASYINGTDLVIDGGYSLK